MNTPAANAPLAEVADFVAEQSRQEMINEGCRPDQTRVSVIQPIQVLSIQVDPQAVVRWVRLDFGGDDWWATVDSPYAYVVTEHDLGAVGDFMEHEYYRHQR